ncbi:hypothetical protein Tco_0934449 [Tanacetum coccineum]
MSNAAVKSPPSSPTSKNAAVEIQVEISTPPVDLEISAPDKGSTPLVRMRGDGVRMGGDGVRMRGDSEDVSSEAGSSSINRLRTINGKIVRMREKGDGSRAYMYPGGRKLIGFGVSWDPVDGEAILGVSNLAITVLTVVNLYFL